MNNKAIDYLYSYFGFTAITIAGLYLAAMAHNVGRFDAWVVAYAVLVMGVAQIAVGKGISKYHTRKVITQPALMIFTAFNIANVLVILGRGMDVTPLVFIGMLGIIVSMLWAILLVRGAKFSPQLLLFYVFSAGLILGSIAGSILTVIL